MSIYYMPCLGHSHVPVLRGIYNRFAFVRLVHTVFGCGISARRAAGMGYGNNMRNAGCVECARRALGWAGGGRGGRWPLRTAHI
eukprot:6282589-Prymnesium_polylepis.1